MKPTTHGTPTPASASARSEAAAPRTAPSVFGRSVWPLRSDLLLVGFWSLTAMVLGRGLSQALPGMRAGIGALIVGVDQLSAFATQFAVVAGVAACLRLLLSTTKRSRGRWFRPVSTIGCATALPLIISASSRDLEPSWLLTLTVGSGALGLLAALISVASPRARVAGLVLLAATLGSLSLGVARLIALDASGEAQASLFRLSRAIATGALVLDLLATGMAAAWVSRRLPGGRWLLLGLGCAAGLVVWLALDAGEGDHLTLVLERSLDSLTSHPDPFIGSGVRYFAELLALFVACVALWIRQPDGVGAALSFALLSRVSGDVPLCALMLLVSALTAVRASIPAQGAGRRRNASETPAQLEVVSTTR